MWSAVNILGAFCLVLCTILPCLASPGCNTPLATTPKDSYDYVIVGGGSAGATLAARLSEDQDVSVVLLEAGEDDRENFLIYTPGYGALTYDSFLDWQYPCESNDKFKSFINNAPHFNGGKVLGGGSSINAMYYVRGSKNDYNLWASYTGDSSWRYENVLPYFIKSESTTEERLKNSPYHGTCGGLYTSARATSSMTEKLLEAGAEAGWYVNPDYNGERQIGIAISQTTTGKGQRCPSSRAFLHEALHRPNLDVIVRAFVTRVIIIDDVAVGVEVKIGDTYHNVTADRQVILSAGAIQSPKLLMLSGIGPKDLLESLEIPVIADLPGVGQNLMDHIFYDVSVEVDEPIGWTLSEFLSSETLMTYLHYHKGPLSSNMGGEGVLFAATEPEDDAIDWPDIEIHLGVIPSNDGFAQVWHTNEQSREALKHRNDALYGFTGSPVLLRPKSRGHITINSTDPFQKPTIFANYYDEPEDVERVLKGVRMVQHIANTTVMQGIGAKETESESYFPCEHQVFDTDEFWRCQITSKPMTINHPTGTAKMGPLEDHMSVVDSQLRVHGVKNLRVIDGSIMPFIVSGNTNAPIIMIAEKMADLIRGKEPLPPFTH